MEKFKKYLKKHPPMILALSFMGLIIMGSLLLLMPVSQSENNVAYIDCLFTSTSAVCVTGLVTVPTFSAWTAFGKFVIIVLIQMGGLGFMTFTTLLALTLRKRVSFSDRIILKEQTNSDDLSGMVKLITYILKATFIIETVGAILLMFSFVPEYGLKGVAYSFFHSISAFCNAGFDIIKPDSLVSINHNKLVLSVLGTLVFLGGLGFVVFSDLIKNKFKFKKLHLHTKFVLVTTFLLLSISTIAFFFIEGNNPDTLKGYSFADKFINSLFQSITLRTAGFASINQAKITQASVAIGVVNMFIGGSPAGTAGGIKTTTFALLVVAVISEIKQREDVEVFQRRVNGKLIRKALTTIMLGLLWVSTVTIIILILTNRDLSDVIYEVASAFATVGLSRNLTPSLDVISKILIILSMYVGRTGLMTVILALKAKTKKKYYREAEESVIIG